MQLQMATSFLLRKPDKNNTTIFGENQKYRMRNLKGILGYMCARATPKSIIFQALMYVLLEIAFCRERRRVDEVQSAIFF